MTKLLPTPSLLSRRLRRNLTHCLTRPKESFAGLPGFRAQTCKRGVLLLRDTGSPILGIAHLDTVLSATPKWSGETVVAPQLDDRLGVWVLLHLLPAMGCPQFDVLLTDCEESSNSTAAAFVAPRKYNWLFQFDRAGTDVVTYDYEDDDTECLLTDAGFKTAFGSYSDICELYEHGCKGFNFGVGYHRQHTAACFADLADTVGMAQLFVGFAREHHETHFPHRHIDWREKLYTRTPTTSSRRVWSSWDVCTDCGNDVDPQWSYCPWCGVNLAWERF